MLVASSMKWQTRVLRKVASLRLFQCAVGRRGSNIYCSLQLRILAALHAQVAEDKLIVPLTRDEAPNKQILRQIIHFNCIQVLKLRNTMFTQDVSSLVQQHGAVVCSIIWSCQDSVVSYWMKAITQTLPVTTYLHRINQTKHTLFCTHCSPDDSQKENLLHSFICPKFHHIRTAAHTQVCKD